MPFNKVIFNGKTLIDLTSDTVTEDALLEGYTAHKSDGSIITGKAKASDPNEAIKRILTSGLADGYKIYLDDGTIISNGEESEVVLTKTFSADMTVCTTTLTTKDGTELGKTVKTYSKDFSSFTTVDHLGTTLNKTFSADLKACVSELLDDNGNVLAMQNKVFLDDGRRIETTIDYQPAKA